MKDVQKHINSKKIYAFPSHGRLWVAFPHGRTQIIQDQKTIASLEIQPFPLSGHRKRARDLACHSNCRRDSRKHNIGLCSQVGTPKDVNTTQENINNKLGKDREAFAHPCLQLHFS